MKSFILLLGIFVFSSVVFSAEEDSSAVSMWPNGKFTSSETGKVYTTAIHNRHSELIGLYQEGGAFYYGDGINSFGSRDVLNVKQEMIFCGVGDMSFSDNLREVISNSVHAEFSPFDGSETVLSSRVGTGVLYDSERIGFTPDAMELGMVSSLQNNATSSAKGRFCYSQVDPYVNYKEPAAAESIYCDETTALSYVDSVSGFSCELKLDIVMKKGETRFMRQLQSTSPTIAQGFVGCYANPVSGVAEASLVDNPSDCSPANRESCTRTCDWAEDVVCDPRDLDSSAIRWGIGNSCGAYGTILFRGDVINVESSPQLSYDSGVGALFQGNATVSCLSVGGVADWVITGTSCSIVE